MPGLARNSCAPAYVASTAELAATPAGAFEPGTIVCVVSVGAVTPYGYAATGATPSGGVAANGGGHWVPLSASSSTPPLPATDWYINASTGNDSNAGTSSAPLATARELARRWALAGEIRTRQTVTLQTSLGASDCMSIVVPIRAGGFVHVIGATRAATTTSSIAAVTQVLDAAANQEWRLQFGAGWAWPGTAARVRITSGPRVGTVFYAARNMGGSVARVSPPTLGGWSDVGPSFTPSAVTPVVGDAVVVEPLWSIPRLVVSCDGGEADWDIPSQIVFENLSFPSDVGAQQVCGGALAPLFINCAVSVECFGSRVTFYNCSSDSNAYCSAVAGADVAFCSGFLAAPFTVSSGAQVLFVLNSLAQYGPLVVVKPGGVARIGGAAVFDCASTGATHATLVLAAGVMLQISGQGYGLWGSGNAYAIYLGGDFFYDGSPPIITSTSFDIEFQFTGPKNWADLPFLSPNGARAAQNA